MPPGEVATRHVVDRCPSCGVEHDVRAVECEACGSILRAWCRRHSHEIGWLDTPACARCVEDAARAARPVIAPVRPPAPEPAAGPAPAVVRGGRDGVRMSDAERPAPPWQPGLASYAASLMLMVLGLGIGGGFAALIFVLPILTLLGAHPLVMAPGLALAGAIAGGLYGLACFDDYVQKVRREAAEYERSARSSSARR